MPGVSSVTALAGKKRKAKKKQSRQERVPDAGTASTSDCGTDASASNTTDEQTEASESDADQYGPQYQTRKKLPKPGKKGRDEMLAAERHAKAKGVRTVIPRFQRREFASFEEFDDALATMFAETNTTMSIRTSTTVKQRNNTLRSNHKKAQQRAKSAGKECTHKLVILPESHVYFQRVYFCVHATYQPDRVPPEDRERNQISTRYTGCGARVTAQLLAERDDDASGGLKWRVVLRQENTIHNHACTPQVFNSYLKGSDLGDDELFENAVAQIRADANGRKIRGELSDGLGRPFSRQEYSNLIHYRLGGGDAEDNLDKLIDAFTSVEGNRCVVIHDQNDLIVGIIFQSAIQRQLFRRFGDSLILDWTHNTNTLGFYLGCIMATSATGKGVPVLDFLCLTQGVDMMTTVLEEFVEGVDGALDVVESFVIDKDYKEWKAVNTVFAKASVVLCQFHVLKWFKTVVNNPRYAITKANRPVVLQLVRDMLYAESESGFDRCKSRLLKVLPISTHAIFHSYMQKRWFECKEMWANHARGKIFTAGNTTSNRLESHWHQFKATLGKKRRIDRCVEAILLRQTAILRRELEEISEATTTTRVLLHEHDFVRPLLQDLSTFTGKLVKRQWDKGLARSDRYCCLRGTDDTGAYTLCPSSSSGMRFVVHANDSGPWSCTCRFATTHRLPCRHQFYIAKSIKCFEFFPMSALRTRWKMSAAADLVDFLEEAAESLRAMRLNKLIKQRFEDAGEPADVIVQLREPKKPKYRKVRRFERANVVVLDDSEKRNIIEGQCERLVLHLQAFGTPEFWKASAQLEVAISTFISCVRVGSENLSAEGGECAATKLKNAAGAQSGAGAQQDYGGVKEGVNRVCHAAAAKAGAVNASEGAVAVEANDDSTSVEAGVVPPEVVAQVHAAGEDASQLSDADEFEKTYAEAGYDTASDSEGDDDDEGDRQDEDVRVRTFSDFGSPFDIDTSHDFDYSPVLVSAHGPIRFPEASTDDFRDFMTELFPLDDYDAREMRALSCVLMNTAPRDASTSKHFPTKTPPTDPTPPSTRARSIRDLLNSDENRMPTVGDVLDSQEPAPVPTEQATCGKRSGALHEDSSRAHKQQKLGLIPKNSLKFRGCRLPEKISRGRPRTMKQQSGRAARLSCESAKDGGASTTATPDPKIGVSDLLVAVRYAPLSAARRLVSSYPRDTQAEGHDRMLTVTQTHDHVDPMKVLLDGDTVDSVIATIKKYREKQAAPEEPGARGAGAYVALIHKTMHKTAFRITEGDAEAMAAIYRDRKVLFDINELREWLDTPEDWVDAAEADVPFLDKYARECAVDAVGGKTVVKVMRDLILNRLESVSLNTVVATSPAARGGVPVRDFARCLTQREWLNSSTVALVLSKFATEYDDVVIIDPLYKGKIKVPAQRLRDQRLVVFPVNVLEEHWCTICVVLDWQAVHKAYSYDPLDKPAKYGRAIEVAWGSWVKPLLSAWFARDKVTSAANKVASAALPIDLSELPSGSEPATSTKPQPAASGEGIGELERFALNKPKQTDGWNCGVFCIAHVLCFMANDYAFLQLPLLSPAQLNLMRLRILYLLLLKCTTRIDETSKIRAKEAVTLYESSEAPCGQEGKKKVHAESKV